ncbi:MAG: hypothetical protein O2945_23195 [Planctomycetota bacterium]|nr:hypothetical protein [Planctomycetota bacterium]MDA0921982.1 hypothetical protein [Planctomycetota bacterium]
MRKATDAERQQMEAAFLAALLERGVATTDDAHSLFELPDDVQPKVWGSIVGALQAMGFIRRIGETQTRRPVAHGRRIGVFIANDVEDVKEYLGGLLRSLTRRRRETHRMRQLKLI